jgi:hypothetical protein
VALTPLTRVQQATVLALVEARRLDVVPADLARATSFVRQAEERLGQLPLRLRPPAGALRRRGGSSPVSGMPMGT